MKTIEVALSTTNWFSSRFLRWAQRCPYSHVEFMFTDEETGERYAIGARTKGVKKHTDFEYFTKILPCYIDVTDEEYAKIMEFIDQHLGEKYDWRAYLGFALFKNTHDKDAWFCSEFVHAAFVYAGVNVLQNTPSYYTMPRDFWISPSFREDKEGPAITLV